MAYKIVITENFEKTIAVTFRWLELVWSKQSADKFEIKLRAAIKRIEINPSTGKLSNKIPNMRSVPVTKHNRIYYSIVSDTIILLELFETKQNPAKNKFEK